MKRRIFLAAFVFMAAITSAPTWADCPDQVVCYYFPPQNSWDGSPREEAFVGIINTPTCFKWGNIDCVPWQCPGNSTTIVDWLKRCRSEFAGFYDSHKKLGVCVAFPVTKVTSGTIPSGFERHLCADDSACRYDPSCRVE